MYLQTNDYEIVDFMVKNLKDFLHKNPLKALIMERFQGHKDKYGKGIVS
jgi:hypothetical protein